MNEIHTVFGAGQVGLRLARVLAGQGHAVRLVRRGAAGPAIEGVSWLRGDATDPEFCDAACAGATTVYNCTNPPDYAKWDGVLQPLYRAIWHAAARAKARLVQLDNLYMYGELERGPLHEGTPMTPRSPKGELRRDLAEELLGLHAAGTLEVAIGRASDYFGPGAINAAVMRPEVVAKAIKGGSLYVLCNPDMPHSYTYLPDVARGLAVLGTADGATGRVWMLPTSAHETTRSLLERFASQAGTEVTVRRVPRWVLQMAGVVVPLVRALLEMDYQWEQPFVLDDGDFVRTFGVHATPLDEAIRATLAEEGFRERAQLTETAA